VGFNFRFHLADGEPKLDFASARDVFSPTGHDLLARSL
jgi:hypothetical protein